MKCLLIDFILIILAACNIQNVQTAKIPYEVKEKGAQTNSSSTSSGSGELIPLSNNTFLSEITTNQVEITSGNQAYATFQSHNQKVVQNSGGIFLSLLDWAYACVDPSLSCDYGLNNWKIFRSQDGGKTFKTILSKFYGSSAPVLELNQSGELFAGFPNFSSSAFTSDEIFRIWRINGDYSGSYVENRIRNASAGKYSMIFDKKRRVFYQASNNVSRAINVLDSTGRLIRSVNVLTFGQNADIVYPHFAMDENGVLYFAWTTQRYGIYLYWDIHFMISPDGAYNWYRLDGTKLVLPVPADESGPSDRVTLDNEFIVHTWLSNMIVHNNHLHFSYLAQFPEGGVQHHVVYDLATKTRKYDYPVWRGETISLKGLDGFCARSPKVSPSPLYCVFASNSHPGRLAGLATDDDGKTWYDYALSSRNDFNPYSIGGSREITSDGFIIGSFTDQKAPSNGETSVHFIKFQAGRSFAEPYQMVMEASATTVYLSNPRGFPKQIRFFDASKKVVLDWSDYKSAFSIPVASGFPTYFEIKSSMGVTTGPFQLVNAATTGTDVPQIKLALDTAYSSSCGTVAVQTEKTPEVVGGMGSWSSEIVRSQWDEAPWNCIDIAPIALSGLIGG